MKKSILIVVIFGVFLLAQPIGAQTWNASKRLTWTAGSSYYPAVATDTNNHIHVVWEDYTPGHGEVYYKRSTNGGTSWTMRRLTWTSGEAWAPAIAADSNNHIHVVWHDITPGNIEIYYKRSANGGVTWGAAKRLTWNSGASTYATVVADTNNRIHVVWHDKTPGNSEVYYKRSTNNGVSWGGSKRFTWNSGFSEVPIIASDSNNNIQVVWYDDSPGNFEIFYKRSTNGGAAWGGNKRLTWNSGGSFSPAIATDSNNHIHVVWSDDTPSRPEIFYKKSTNGGASWSTKRISWTSGYSYTPMIAVDPSNRIHVVWEDWSHGFPEIYYKRSTNGGTSWTIKRLSYNNGWSVEPAIAVDSNSRIYVVWEDNPSGPLEIYYRKGIQ
jgi:hypothetical protein